MNNRVQRDEEASGQAEEVPAFASEPRCDAPCIVGQPETMGDRVQLRIPE
jgi:hypothetical protein